MLKAQAKGFMERTYEVFENDHFLAAVKLSSWKESAVVELGGKQYRFKRDKTFSGPFLLLEVENVIAYAQKPSAFKDRFLVAYSGRSFEFRKPSIWKNRFELEESGKPAGFVESRGFFRREYVADLPEELPAVVRLFILWLTLIIAKRQQAAAGG